MSVSASIDLKILDNKLKIVYSLDLLKCLHEFGWSFDDDGQMSYLPLKDDGMFNWEREDTDEQKMYMLLAMKRSNDELIGVTITWQNTGIGGELLISNNGELSFIISINRKIIITEGIVVATDFNWYLERLIKPLKDNDYLISLIKCDETL